MGTRVAAVQLAPVDGDPEATLVKCETWLDRAGEEGAQLAVLPEGIYPGFAGVDDAHRDGSPEAIARLAQTLEPVGGHATRRIVAKAAEHGMVVVFGLLARADSGMAVNASVLIDATGEVRGVHHKMHLTPDYETGVFERGEQFSIGETAVGPVGHLVCADCTLPETSRILAIKGATIVCASFAVFYFDDTDWPEGGMHMYLHAHTSTARALDNDVYFVAANMTAESGGLRYFGRSRIISPSGQVLAEGREGVDAEEIVIADLEPERDRRLPFSLIDRRRPELYAEILTPNSMTGEVRWRTREQLT